MDEYCVTYRHKHGRKEYVVVMPNLQKLLKWIEKNGPRCSYVLIQVSEV